MIRYRYKKERSSSFRYIQKLIQNIIKFKIHTCSATLFLRSAQRLFPFSVLAENTSVAKVPDFSSVS